MRRWKRLRRKGSRKVHIRANESVQAPPTPHHRPGGLEGSNNTTARPVRAWPYCTYRFRSFSSPVSW